MLAGIPKSSRSEAADELLLNASLLARDNAGACAVARGRAATSGALIFAKMLTVCEALSGDTARAELGAGLLAEQDPNDPAFFELLDMMTGAVSAPGRAVAALKVPVAVAFIDDAGAQRAAASLAAIGCDACRNRSAAGRQRTDDCGGPVRLTNHSHGSGMAGAACWCC